MKAVTLWCFLLLFLLNTAFAITVSNLDVSQVPIKDRSADARPAAIQLAFNNTLVKITGNPAITDVPTIKAALQHPDEWVQSYEYVDTKTNDTDDLMLQVHFDSDGISQLLKEANQTTWDANRPLTLLYLRASDGDEATFQQSLMTQATDRGIPLMLPDTDMSQAVFKEAVQSELFLTSDQIETLQSHYAVDGLLSVHLLSQNDAHTAIGQYCVKSHCIAYEWMAHNQADLAQKILNHVTEMMQNDHADNATVTSSQLTMSITGVDDIEAYGNVMSYLRSKKDVSNVTVNNVGSTGMLISFTLSGDVNAFKTELANDGKLKPVNAELIGNDHSADLFYYW